MKKTYNFIDLTGQRFGRLIVKKYLGESKWLCKCDCGKETIVRGQYLRTGHTKSCGCLKKEKCYEMHKINQKYKNIPLGIIQDRLARIYNKMVDRCYNKNSKAYFRYGARGIKVCEEWQTFENFYYWAINNGFDITKKWYECSIDRINNSGNYEPNNCRWATAKQQARNRRSNHLVNYNNKVYCISELAEKLNLSNYKVKKYYA